MSDPTIKEKNDIELELLFEKKERLGKKELKQQEFIRYYASNISVDLEELKAGAVINSPHIIAHDYFVTPITDIVRSNELEHRVTSLEETVKWLLEDKITIKSNDFLSMIKEEFSLIPFIREIYSIKTSSGFNLIIIHDEENSDIALSSIMKSKLSLKKKLQNVYLELTVIHTSDFNKKDWESREVIFKRH